MVKKTNEDTPPDAAVTVFEEILEPIVLMLATTFAEQYGYKPEIVKAVKTLNPSYQEYLSTKDWTDIFEALMIKPVSVKWDIWLNEFKTRRK